MVRMFAKEGSRGEAYCTGSGKALLANLEENQILEYIKTIKLENFTKNTITKPENLIKELKTIKKQGYALDLEEKEIGVRCVAAPLFDGNHRLMGAISVSGPCTRITEDYLKSSLIPLVRDKAKQITSLLERK